MTWIYFENLKLQILKLTWIYFFKEWNHSLKEGKIPSANCVTCSFSLSFSRGVCIHGKKGNSTGVEDEMVEKGLGQVNIKEGENELDHPSPRGLLPTPPYQKMNSRKKGTLNKLGRVDFYRGMVGGKVIWTSWLIRGGKGADGWVNFPFPSQEGPRTNLGELTFYRGDGRWKSGRVEL